MLDSQGRVLLPEEFRKAYDIMAGDKISYAYESHFCYRLYCTDDRPYNVTKVAGAESTVDKKGRIIVPASIRQLYTEKCLFVEKNEKYYLIFFACSNSSKWHEKRVRNISLTRFFVILKIKKLTMKIFVL